MLTAFLIGSSLNYFVFFQLSENNYSLLLTQQAVLYAYAWTVVASLSHTVNCLLKRRPIKLPTGML